MAILVMGLASVVLSLSVVFTGLSIASPVALPLVPRDDTNLTSCPGYKATNVRLGLTGLTADLTLAGVPCNVYGTDLQDLTLTVEYQTSTRLHVLIQDAAAQVYQVPSSVFTRPSGGGVLPLLSEIQFDYVAEPFSFSIKRALTGEVLFDTSAASIVFENQYLRLRTHLPANPSLYGLAEHTDPFMLNTTNYTRTIWNRDAYEIPSSTNLYGDHPVYFDHRNAEGTHGVFLLNSNGMDIKIDNIEGQYLEYNTLGGVLDFYFLAGPTPVEVAQQYSLVVGTSAMMPYWGLGFHQCRYGMQDVYEVAEVVANYSAAAIPLETMWTDIDYMDLRRVFTLDPLRFPLDLMRQLVQTIHDRQQHYIVMVDPAVAYQDYPAFNAGAAADAFLKFSNGSIYQGVVWPGPTVFPDWFASGTQAYWTSQFASFFSADTGVDIDALWIDMNEASNFCDYPCADPAAFAITNGDPPAPPAVRLCAPRPIEGFPADFQPCCHADIDFSVFAKTHHGENIYVLGSAITIGNWDISNAVLLSADDYPVWMGTIDVPANVTITYQYVWLDEGGSWVYENINRTIATGGCGSVVATNDTITTAEGTPPPPRRVRIRDIVSSPSHLSRHFQPPNPIFPRSVDGSSVGGGSTAAGKIGLPGRNLITPPYTINNAAGTLSDKTLNTDLIHQPGYAEYDTHNLYGAMMSETSRQAMLARRPTLRPMVITRSTFAGSGAHVGHWLGDNEADWAHYLISVAELLEFGALYQVPTVGSDVCGYAGVTNEALCARWASLGAFSPFYRNHGEIGVPPHEFYRWGNDSIVAAAARNAIAVRYRLLDYLYTALYDQSTAGTPAVQPMFFAYPADANANALQYQYLFGPSVMVAPVTLENSTTTDVYLPDDVLYDFYTGAAVRGRGAWTTLTDVAYDSIPLYYKGGAVVAERASSANTTAELRGVSFAIVVAPGLDGTATGGLYLDDGVSLQQPATSYMRFAYDTPTGLFSMTGSFGYDAGDVVIESIRVLGEGGATHNVHVPLTGPYVTVLRGL